MIPSLYPCFQHWSAKGSVWLVGDTHFEDEDREFMGYNHSEDEQIAWLKKYCHKNDTLIHLGDVGKFEYIDQLKCYKVLIAGNHDKIGEAKKHFNEVYTGPLMITDRIILSHEPVCLLLGITNAPIAFNIHGHDHSGEYYNDDYHINLAQNVWGIAPTDLNWIIKDGLIKHIISIHRATIDHAKERQYDI